MNHRSRDKLHRPKLLYCFLAMNSTTKPALLRILGVAFGIAAVGGATIGGGIVRVPGTVAALVPEPALLLALLVLVAMSYPLYRLNRA